MGCNCKKNVRQEPQVITSTPQVIQIPQTPEELHAQELNQWNGGDITIEKDKQEN
jgi:hypothetical protein